MTRQAAGTASGASGASHPEIRAALWAARHPGIVSAPAALGAGLLELGPTPMEIMTGATIASAAAWWRAHPRTFEYYLGARLRAFRRRWLAYVGFRWVDVMHHCDLTATHRRTGRVMVPRILRVRSATPTLDTIYVRMVRGQSETRWLQHAEELADGLIAHRVAITRVRPQVLALTVERGNPFTTIIPAAEIPECLDEIDFTALEMGDDEYGNVWTEDFTGGHHFLGAGATGSGKSGLMWNPLLGLGPAIREGIVRVRMIDLKGGLETSIAEPLFYRYATDVKSGIEVLQEHRDDMRDTQARLVSAGLRRALTPTREYPLDLLMIDEFAMFTVLSEGATEARKAVRLMGELMTQGRATQDTVCAYMQEPDKQTNPLRDLFPVRVCLRVVADSHPDMVLGDKMRERGALADQIPMDEAHTGTGFKVHQRSRTPMRVRAGLVEDHHIAELVRTCSPRPTAPVTPLPARTHQPTPIRTDNPWETAR